ncbi:selenocysteine lyase-like isoform X1 [Clavelina lepadiformis]|uniref:selenocysteine lyase-like isoform X1 n=1 Tax=Clavelina lepadiformis TaxID=159417 RepID=UPI0040418CEE
MLYFDFNATTPLADEVIESIKDALTVGWGNPSSKYDAGLQARMLIEEARNNVAACIGAASRDIIFTSGGSESNNWVIYSAVENYEASCISRSESGETYRKPHIVTTTVEHDSVSAPLQALENKGKADITKVPINKTIGEIVPSDVVAAIQPNTCLVTIMMANNETGTIMPIQEISSAVRRIENKLSSSIMIHTDAAQAIGKIPVNVNELGVDCLTLAGHKFYGPRIGALYVKNLNNKTFHPFILGGGQENGWRAGTENTPMIVGLGKAAALVRDYLNDYTVAMEDSRDYLEIKMAEIFGNKNITFNCKSPNKLPNTCNVSILGKGLEGYKVVKNAKGFCCSTGSACHSGNCEPSKILLSFHVGKDVARNAIRISTGRHTNRKQIDSLVMELRKVVDDLKTTVEKE